jgi:hypothetical protein
MNRKLACASDFYKSALSCIFYIFSKDIRGKCTLFSIHHTYKAPGAFDRNVEGTGCFFCFSRKEMSMSNELKTYTLQELYAHPMEPISWLAEGLLAPGLYFLGGSPKVGKSWLALQLCLAVCRGEPFLGFRTRKSEVLYLALEDGPRRLHTRALRLTEEAPAGLHLCGHAPMIGQGLEQQLDQMLAEHPGIRLVIIDTLQKVRMVAGANASYGNDYQDAAALKELADRCNVCLLVIHHLRKMPDEDPFNRLSGTNGLTGAADGTIILIRQKRQEGTALLTATGRDIEDRELTLEFSDCCWSRSCSPDELQLMYLLPAIRQLLASGEFLGSATELVEKLGQQGSLWGPAQLSRYLQSHKDALAAQGILLDTKRSNHKRFLSLCLTESDTGDGNDGCDSGGQARDVPSQPSSPSLSSQAS